MDSSLDITNENIHCQMLLQTAKMGKLNLIEDIPFLSAFIGFLGKDLTNLDRSPPKPKNKRKRDLNQFWEMANNEGHAFNPSIYEGWATSNNIFQLPQLKARSSRNGQNVWNLVFFSQAKSFIQKSFFSKSTTWVWKTTSTNQNKFKVTILSLKHSSRWRNLILVIILNPKHTWKWLQLIWITIMWLEWWLISTIWWWPKLISIVIVRP